MQRLSFIRETLKYHVGIQRREGGGLPVCLRGRPDLSALVGNLPTVDFCRREEMENEKIIIIKKKFNFVQ